MTISAAGTSSSRGSTAASVHTRPASARLPSSDTAFSTGSWRSTSRVRRPELAAITAEVATSHTPVNSSAAKATPIRSTAESSRVGVAPTAATPATAVAVPTTATAVL